MRRTATIPRALSPALETFARRGGLPDVFERYGRPLNVNEVKLVFYRLKN